jgi:hypothetical protein
MLQRLVACFFLDCLATGIFRGPTRSTKTITNCTWYISFDAFDLGQCTDVSGAESVKSSTTGGVLRRPRRYTCYTTSYIHFLCMVIRRITRGYRTIPDGRSVAVVRIIAAGTTKFEKSCQNITTVERDIIEREIAPHAIFIRQRIPDCDLARSAVRTGRVGQFVAFVSNVRGRTM